ncbi:T-cell surface glycoprotein CD8 alpha chain [Engraulis encrasicolus]|uniref:T-cell surface glycoprotein CD8 alpha chain n=1 Tax=Engraulis encrasicolus TaxID=184585 RepID=UPI002FD710F5
MWLRASQKGIEFLVTFKNGNKVSKTEPEFINIGDSGYSLTIKSFQKKRDSGSYNCATYNANTLTFGNAQRLEGIPEKNPTKKPETRAPTTCKPSTVAAVSTTPAPCVCPEGSKREEKRCELLIWAPLAGGCGLLLILLITVSIICNQVRTRRCPHHYKRQPRTAGGMSHPGAARYV